MTPKPSPRNTPKLAGASDTLPGIAGSPADMKNNAEASRRPAPKKSTAAYPI
jgi:hypothetical protein